jgi:hypothetical protein
VEQYVKWCAIPEMQAAHAAAPSPYIAPNHALILDQMRARVESLGRDTPDLAGRLAEVTGHVLLSTVPTGELNASTSAVPGMPVYCILFDPMFFDIIDCFSDFFARAIDGQAARKAAYEYGQSGIETDLTRVMRGDDRRVVGDCYTALSSLLFKGTPPLRMAPRREASEPFAIMLRVTSGLFVTAHEYGHVLLRHPNLGRDAMTRVEKEFRADRVACGIVLAYGEKVKSIRTERFIGTHFFLVSALLIEAIRRGAATCTRTRISDLIADKAPNPEDTHPSTSLRLLEINTWLESTYPPDLYRGTQYFAALLIDLAERLLDCVQPALQKRVEGGETLKTGWYQMQPTLDMTTAAGTGGEVCH